MPPRRKANCCRPSTGLKLLSRMQASKSTNSSSNRRASGPVPANTRQPSEALKPSGNYRRSSETPKAFGKPSGNPRSIPETPKPSSNVSESTRQTPEVLKISEDVSGNTRQNSVSQNISGNSNTSTTTSSVDLLKATQAVADPTTAEQEDNAPLQNFKPPLIMIPPSKITKGPRRSSRPEVPISERPLTWDPEHYNPDGSLRTMHKLPGFDQSYAQAMQARYIRHKQPVDREKELSVNEIFGKGDQK